MLVAPYPQCCNVGCLMWTKLVNSSMAFSSVLVGSLLKITSKTQECFKNFVGSNSSLLQNQSKADLEITSIHCWYIWWYAISTGGLILLEFAPDFRVISAYFWQTFSNFSNKGGGGSVFVWFSFNLFQILRKWQQFTVKTPHESLLKKLRLKITFRNVSKGKEMKRDQLGMLYRSVNRHPW